MEGVKKNHYSIFERIKHRALKLLGYHSEIATDYQGMRLPASLQLRCMQTFLVLFAVIFTSMFIIVGYQPAPTDAINYPELNIAAIQLDTTVAPIEPVDRRLDAPATIAGAYSQNNNKTLIIGHSTTVFQDLHKLAIGNTIMYGNRKYTVTKIETLPKSEVNMQSVLASTKRETIVIMTCAGELLENQDATHRLLVTAMISQ